MWSSSNHRLQVHSLFSEVLFYLKTFRWNLGLNCCNAFALRSLQSASLDLDTCRCFIWRRFSFQLLRLPGCFHNGNCCHLEWVSCFFYEPSLTRSVRERNCRIPAAGSSNIDLSHSNRCSTRFWNYGDDTQFQIKSVKIYSLFLLGMKFARVTTAMFGIFT